MRRPYIVLTCVLYLFTCGCHKISGDPYLDAFARMSAVYKSLDTDSPLPCTEADAKVAEKILTAKPRVEFLKARALDSKEPYGQEAAIWALHDIKWSGLPDLIASVVSNSSVPLSRTAIYVLTISGSLESDPVPALAKIIAFDKRPEILRSAMLFSFRGLEDKRKTELEVAVRARLRNERKLKTPNSEVIATLEKYMKEFDIKP